MLLKCTVKVIFRNSKTLKLHTLYKESIHYVTSFSALAQTLNSGDLWFASIKNIKTEKIISISLHSLNIPLDS